jgi:2-polyprenyl-3-methyl-5-hydroxy-6-metoxy-1,4-benzoquinol methylase
MRAVRIGAKPENPIEAVIARLNVAPVPLLETQIAYTLARVVMAGVRLGIFDALADGDATAEQVAQRCGTHPRATGKLLFALAGAGYLKASDGGYGLTPVSRKWLLSDSEHSLADKLLLQFHEWDWMGLSEDYVRTGKPLDLHAMIDEDQWDLYQRGMRSMARGLSSEVTRRMPVPGGAVDMLDIGGSHGYYSVALCRKHDGLSATILDLPEAVKQAAPLLAEEGMGDRVVHQEGDALSDDLGEHRYDLVMTAQLVHHFSDEQNRELTKRIARALRPGGVYAIVEEFRSPTPKDAGQVGALLDFYFALTSQAGTWAPEEMADWQRAAGLDPRKTIRFRTLPGSGIQAATKPR